MTASCNRTSSPRPEGGVQVGELVLVTETGFERLHRVGRGFFRIG